MSEYSYIKLNRYMHLHKKLSKICVFLCRAITLLIYVFYPAYLIYLFFCEKPLFVVNTLVPLISVILLSFLRAKINLQRPYEAMDITPLYNKKTVGKSFPSRHTFAIFIIAFSVMTFNLPLGFAITLLGILLAILRVLLGVHYVRDVLVGFLFAVISALIGYVII